jgi:hypothetical protein
MSDATTPATSAGEAQLESDGSQMAGKGEVSPSVRAFDRRMANAAARKVVIRREYETTNKSIRQLAAENRYSSDNQIRRWIAKEGWQRDVRAIAQSLAAQKIANGGPADTGHTIPDGRSERSFLTPEELAQVEKNAQLRPPVEIGRLPPEKQRSPHLKQAARGAPGSLSPDDEASRVGPDCAEENSGESTPKKKKVGRPRKERRISPILQAEIEWRAAQTQGADGQKGGAHTTPKGVTSTANPGSGPKPYPGVGLVAGDLADLAPLDLGQGLFKIQAKALRKQAAVGDVAIATGMVMMRNIETLTDQSLTEEKDSAVLAGAARRLMGVNPKRETLAGLAMAAMRLIKTGVALQREALGMDLLPPEPLSGAGNAGDAGAMSGKALLQQQILDDMPTDMLEQMRQLLHARLNGRPVAIVKQSGRGIEALTPPMRIKKPPCGEGQGG